MLYYHRGSTERGSFPLGQFLQSYRIYAHTLPHWKELSNEQHFGHLEYLDLSQPHRCKPEWRSSEGRRWNQFQSLLFWTYPDSSAFVSVAFWSVGSSSWFSENRACYSAVLLQLLHYRIWSPIHLAFTAGNSTDTDLSLQLYIWLHIPRASLALIPSLLHLSDLLL